MDTVTEPSNPPTLTYNCIINKGDIQFNTTGKIDELQLTFELCSKNFITFLKESINVVAPGKQYYISKRSRSISKRSRSPDLPSPYSHSNTLDFVIACAFSQLVSSKDASVVLDFNIIPVTSDDVEAMFTSHMNGDDNSITITIAKVELPPTE